MIEIEETFDPVKRNRSDELCRGCLCTSDNLLSIFSPALSDHDEAESDFEEGSPNIRNTEVTYLKMFEDCTSLEVDKMDGKPTSLCSDCIEELTASYSFRNKCINSDRELSITMIKGEQDEEESGSTAGEQSVDNTEITNLKIVPIEELVKLNDTTIDEDEHFMYEDHLIDIADGENELNEDNFEINPGSKIETVIDEVKSIAERNIAEDNIFECQVCKSNFANLNELKLHNSIHNPDRPFKCFEKKCKQCSFKNEEELEMHNFVYHTAENDTKCAYCNKDCKTKRALKSHMKTHSSDRPHKCKSCDKAFIFSHHLKNHEKIHDNVKEFSCPECQKSFINKDRLALHQRIHTGKRPHKCETCDKAFISASSLKIHYATHTAEKPFMCTQCGMCFKLEIFLNTHLKKVHLETHTKDDPEPSVKSKHAKSKGDQKSCNICNTKFETPIECTRHIKTHSYKYFCHICNKPFALKTKLDSHMKNTHSSNLKYVCCVCSDKFHRPDLLRYHYLRKHADGKLPYTCEICERGFITNSDYKVHVRRHYGEKPFVCNFCDKRYITSSELLQHKRFHTGEKPYVCNLCEKPIATINLLLYHIKQHNRDGTGNIDSQRLNQEMKDIESIVGEENVDEIQSEGLEND